MDTVGILPAAGLCSRWNGTFKELLPIGENRWVIDSSIDSMKAAGISDFILVSSPQKISSHIQHFSKEKYNNINVSYVIQYSPTGLYEAIKLALKTARNFNRFIFTMPDTIISNIACINELNILNYSGNRLKLTLGTFTTSTPERFGILRKSITSGIDSSEAYSDFEIVDKPDVSKVKCDSWFSFLDEKIHFTAWGMAGWTDEFSTFVLNSTDITSIGDAFNKYNKLNKTKCLNSFMDAYVDLASWKDYVQWLKENIK